MGIKEELEFLSDQEVVDIHQKALNHLMYYETAEKIYNSESSERALARSRLGEVEEVMKERGLSTDRRILL